MNVTLPLVVANDVERERSWEGISTPHDLAVYISRILAVDPKSITTLQEIIFSDTEPTGEDKNKIWIKTTEPVGLGLPNGNSYRMLYQYPVNVPFIWTEGVDLIPSYLRQLTEDELTDYSLTDPVNENIKWVILNQ